RIGRGEPTILSQVAANHTRVCVCVFVHAAILSWPSSPVYSGCQRADTAILHHLPLHLATTAKSRPGEKILAGITENALTFLSLSLSLSLLPLSFVISYTF